jgi:hypothetical protein
MIGAIEILILAVIVGIIMGRDAIDKTFRKHADEGLVESMAGDAKEFYQDNPKRLIIIIAISVGAIAFLVTLGYWAITRTDLLKMLGWG